MSQEIRNDVGSLLLRLTIRELFSWRFMQTDPNWGNFLYDEQSDQLHLIDFGAAKEYPKPFVDEYLRMVLACADKNRDAVIRHSTNLRFLTGGSLYFIVHSDTTCSIGKLLCKALAAFCIKGVSDVCFRCARSHGRPYTVAFCCVQQASRIMHAQH